MIYNLLILSCLYALSEPGPHLKIYNYIYYYDVLYCKKIVSVARLWTQKKSQFCQHFFLVFCRLYVLSEPDPRL